MSGRAGGPTWLARVLGGAENPARTPSRTAPSRTTPLTRDRVAAALSARGYHYRLDDDGDLTGVWNGNRFWFLLLGEEHEILQVRGRWRQQLPTGARRAVSLTLNDWNRERIWPKVYLREESDQLAIYAEVSTDLEHGVTGDQLDQLISCGLGTAVQAFDSLAGQLPAED